MAAGLLVLLAGCFTEPILVAVKERCFQCLHETCIDSNGYLIGFITPEYLYDDGTKKNGKKRMAFANEQTPDACYGMCKSSWNYVNDLWKCGY